MRRSELKKRRINSRSHITISFVNFVFYSGYSECSLSVTGFPAISADYNWNRFVSFVYFQILQL